MENQHQATVSRGESQLSGLLASLHRGVYDAGLAVERFRSRCTVRSVELDGKSWSFLERPGDGPTVILVHGFTASKDIWLKFLQSFPRNVRVIAPDLMGHGDNVPDLDCPYGAWEFVEALHRVLSELGCDDFHLVGHSLGGLLAAGYAVKHPRELRSLFLVSPAGIQTGELSAFYQVIEDGGENPFFCRNRAEYDDVLELIFHTTPPIAGIAHSILCRDWIDRRPLYEKIWNELNATDEDVAEMLEGVQAKTHVVWGEHDRILHPSCMEVFTERIPDAQGKWLACGHCPPIECPTDLVRLHLELLFNEPRT